MTSLFQILMLLLDVATFFIFAHFIMSWLIIFNVLNIRQPIIAQIWDALQRILEPLYGPVRRLLPQMCCIDLAPLVVLLIIYAIRIILVNNVGAFV